eukprot:8419724-Prorocentrum_lima.AAC.1
MPEGVLTLPTTQEQSPARRTRTPAVSDLAPNLEPTCLADSQTTTSPSRTPAEGGMPLPQPTDTKP